MAAGSGIADQPRRRRGAGGVEPPGAAPEPTAATSREQEAWRRARNEKRFRFDEARRYYLQALEADPGSSEARLRLARTLMETGKHAESLEQLDAVLAGDPEHDLAYLAHLLRGAQREHEGDGAGAEMDFRAALALEPLAQAARLALASLLQARGAVREAGTLVEEGLLGRRQAAARPLDPWWLYPQGRIGEFQAELAQLHRLARAP